ncbi:SRPBCC domain-containing protein [Pokkaliibacter sp. CJK22405]|uniref:SRPBCC domain-containing protein n=1 Tax=Pokkaliibacter sp. CJK22405 TaxID=3384615 RepID=UPI0039846495
MTSIQWPAGYVPGFSDNFCSNEVIVANLSIDKVWALLVTPAEWSGYYANSAHPRFYEERGPMLALGDRFYFETFGFPVEAEVVEYIAPVAGQAGRVAWHGWAGEGAERLNVHHAWIVEELSANRLRILTQETQQGEPAKALAATVPNPMINGHQEWLDGLVSAARA